MALFRDLQLKGPARGYFPEPTKSILVVSEKNVPRAKEYFRRMGVQVVTGSRYLGGCIGEQEKEEQWVQEKVEGWADSVRTLSGVARKHPQSAYAGSAEVNPTGVGIRAAGHPWDQQRVWASGGGDRKGVPPSTVDP